MPRSDAVRLNVRGPIQDRHGAPAATILKLLHRLDKGILPIVSKDGFRACGLIDRGDLRLAHVCTWEVELRNQINEAGTRPEASLTDQSSLV